jgi:hypothetical protein
MLRNKTSGRMVKGTIIALDVWTITVDIAGVHYQFMRRDWDLVLIVR